MSNKSDGIVEIVEWQWRQEMGLWLWSDIQIRFPSNCWSNWGESAKSLRLFSDIQQKTEKVNVWARVLYNTRRPLACRQESQRSNKRQPAAGPALYTDRYTFEVGIFLTFLVKRYTFFIGDYESIIQVEFTCKSTTPQKHSTPPKKGSKTKYPLLGLAGSCCCCFRPSVQVVLHGQESKGYFVSDPLFGGVECPWGVALLHVNSTWIILL